MFGIVYTCAVARFREREREREKGGEGERGREGERRERSMNGSMAEWWV